ncbi:hypothetical protein M404DRAFT_1004704 [Pisolithus tinctorius Marx 270]|uniref:Uncharacterized protein n=1 Tax=Pisolithus tinctorius Marx 270 TaxID=870435 RepID=A0A0C3NW93_PISTI|nr:hypothetical protein M404DRAFT_1004704 [Pisolithus tinctorius Marx 270]
MPATGLQLSELFNVQGDPRDRVYDASGFRLWPYLLWVLGLALEKLWTSPRTRIWYSCLSFFCPVAEATIAQTRKAFELNSFVALCVTKATVPPMMKRHEGLVINIGSIVGTSKTPWNTLHYTASPEALIWSSNHSISM